MYNKYQAFLVAKITYFKNIIMNAFVRMTTKYESSFQKKTKTVIFPTTWFIHQTSFLHSMKRHLVANPTKYHCSIILPFLSSSFRTTYYILHSINSCWRWGLLRLFFFVVTHPNSLLWTHAITEAAASYVCQSAW